MGEREKERSNSKYIYATNQSYSRTRNASNGVQLLRNDFYKFTPLSVFLSTRANSMKFWDELTETSELSELHQPYGNFSAPA